MTRKLLLVLALLSLPFCAVKAQVPNQTGNGVPNGVIIPGTAGSGSFGLFAKSGTASSITGTGTETILATIAIPPNTIGANGQIRIRSYWTTTNNADTKTLRIRLGTTGITASQIMLSSITTFGSPMILTDLQNLNATNSQNDFSEGSRGTDGLVTTVLTTSAVDMTASQNIYITGQLGTTTDTITLTGYSIEVAN